MSVAAHPLAWPPGWKRTTSGRKDAQFINPNKSYIGIADGVRRVLDELKRLGVKEDDVVISTNIRPTLGGRATEGQGRIADPGVAVYWKTAAGQRCIAVDRYTGVAGNLGAVAATLEAMRAVERHGGAAILERAFTGFTALPAPEQAWQVLGVSSHATKEEVNAAYRRLVATAHPDREGGDADQMLRLNAARDELLEHLETRQ